MSSELTTLSALLENATNPHTTEKDSYALLAIFLVGTLIFISFLLVFFHHLLRRGHCCQSSMQQQQQQQQQQQRQHRQRVRFNTRQRSSEMQINSVGRGRGVERPGRKASDETEKSAATYLEESRPTHEITIRVNDSDCVSMDSYLDLETERFLTMGPTGRRVSFNEAALFDHGQKAQEKGRRYTLTEGDFHHLKNSRLTHLTKAPPLLKFVTIHECDSAEITVTTGPVAKSALSIYQPAFRPLPHTPLTSQTINPSCALPGHAFNSVANTGFHSNAMSASTDEIEMMTFGRGGRASPDSFCEVRNVSPVAGTSTGSRKPMIHFLSKLRRRSSLEGASPYLKIKKWNLADSQRASSMDTRGSPKRRPFQCQWTSSESADDEDSDMEHIDLIQYISRDTTYPPQPLMCNLSPPYTSSPSLGRLEVEGTVEEMVEEMVEPSGSHGGPGVIGVSPDPQDKRLSVARRDANPDEPIQSQDIQSQDIQSQDFQPQDIQPQDIQPLDIQPQDIQSFCREIWSLRASLEEHAASDHSSDNDGYSFCSDAESVCSLCARPDLERGELSSYASQDLGDEVEVEEDDEFSVCVDDKFGLSEGRSRKNESAASERGGNNGGTGTRRLKQMDSGYASIEAPYRGPKEGPLLGSSSSQNRTAQDKRHHFTSAVLTGTIGESFESVFEEEPDEEILLGASGGVSTEVEAGLLSWFPYGQMFTPREATQLTPYQRDYSIDQKTDAIFHEFQQHDPQFDLQESPHKKHRSRIQVRKQWQRHKQCSDPGIRHRHSSFERLRTPLRRGQSVNYPLETSYQSTLPRIVSGPDEETNKGTSGIPDTPKKQPRTPKDREKDEQQGDPTSTSPSTIPPTFIENVGVLDDQPDLQEDTKQSLRPPETPQENLPHSSCSGPQTISAELADKLNTNLDERLYTGLCRTKDAAAEYVTVTAAHTSQDHSPV